MRGPDQPGLIGRASHLGIDPGYEARLASWRRLPGSEQERAIWTDEGEFQPRVGPAGGRVRVGLWCPCLGLGGAEGWQLALAKAVDPSRVAWAGAAVIEGRRAVDPRMAAELGRWMPVGLGLGAARNLAAAADLILSWAVVDVESLLGGLRPRPKVIMTCHFPAESPWGGGTSTLLRGVDRFVGVSELAFDAIPVDLRAGARVIWNAVDPDRLRAVRDRAAVRTSWGVPEGSSVAGYLGRLAPEKDPAAMLRLAAALPEGWHVVLVGEGRERAGLEREARRIAPGRAHLVGGDAAAGDVLEAFDALVVPSRFESFGLTLAEGLAKGLPVVATPTGLAKIMPGLVREVPVGADGPTLARAVLLDAGDGASTRARVDAGRRFALDRLGIDRFGREWTDLIVDLAGIRPTCSRHPEIRCRSAACSGAADPGVCSHLRRIEAWRQVGPEDQLRAATGPLQGVDPLVRDAVNACPDRGAVLPISEQDDCGCRGRELSACGAGRGRTPGRVTLRDCLDCRESALGAGRVAAGARPDGRAVGGEAPVGVEPTLADLQSAALPLGYGAFEGRS